MDCDRYWTALVNQIAESFGIKGAELSKGCEAVFHFAYEDAFTEDQSIEA